MGCKTEAKLNNTRRDSILATRVSSRMQTICVCVSFSQESRPNTMTHINVVAMRHAQRVRGRGGRGLA